LNHLTVAGGGEMGDGTGECGDWLFWTVCGEWGGGEVWFKISAASGQPNQLK